MLFRLIFFTSLFFLLGCSIFNKKELSAHERFERAENYFLKNKFQKAKNDFQFILQDEQGSELALESTFYLAKALFELKEYEEANMILVPSSFVKKSFEKFNINKTHVLEFGVNLQNFFPNLL